MNDAVCPKCNGTLIVVGLRAWCVGPGGCHTTWLNFARRKEMR